MHTAIRVMELLDSIHEDRLSKGLGVIQSENLLRKAIEAELDLIEQEPRVQGPLEKLETQHYPFRLLGYLKALLAREDERWGPEG
jgi:translation initiation factor IF-3